jgi:Na+/H+-dicarboxylate symporter
VIVGLLIHGGIVLPLILVLITGRNPFRYVLGMGKALLTAFSTASSSATLPITIECATVENRVSRRSALFVLPVGATVNMDGTALYESVAAIFIAQAYGIELGIGQQAMIFITATLAAVGAAGIPEAGLFTMVLVLKAVGLPLEGIALLLVIDWFLDRCRTTINVWGDSVGAAVIERLDQPGGGAPAGPSV